MDIVFITDGEDSLSTDFKKEFLEVNERKEFKVLTVLVDTGDNTDSSLTDISDEIIKVSNLVDLTSRQDILDNMFNKI